MNTSGAWLRTLLIVFSVVIGIAVIGVATLVAQACLHPWRFPAPTGQYKVGMHDSALVDSSRVDPIIKGTTKRELLVRFYYPANPAVGAKTMRYLDPTPGVLEMMGRMLSLPAVLFSPARKVISHLYVNAAPAQTAGPCPVVIFSHGIGLGTAGQNLVQCGELASRGYVVVSIGHTYESCIIKFPDGRIIAADMARWKQILQELSPRNLGPIIAAQRFAVTSEQKDSITGAYVKALPTIDSSHTIWTDDTRFVIRALDSMHAQSRAGSVEALMDLSRIGIFGHSMGGMTAQKCILDESRFVAGISFDPGPIRENLTDSINKPFMFLQSETAYSASESAFRRCRADTYYGVILGTRHFDFSDIGLWCAGKPFWRLIGFTGALDGYRCHDVLSACTIAFFDKYLKNISVDIVSAVKAYPEIRWRIKNGG